jgi:hypothetical protein
MQCYGQLLRVQRTWADTDGLLFASVLQAVLRSSSGKDVWEKGTNHKADLQGSCDISLYHVFQA